MISHTRRIYMTPEGDGGGGGGGDTPTPWQAALAASMPEHRDNPHISKHETLDSLAQEHINLQGLMGKKGVSLPNKEDEGDVGRFFGDLGRPSTPQGYGRDGFKEDPQIGWNVTVQDRVDDLLHHSGMSTEQHAIVSPGLQKILKDMQEDGLLTARDNAAKSTTQLKQDLGLSYDSKIEAGNRAGGAIYNDLFENEDGSPDRETFNKLQSLVLADGTVLGNNDAWVRGLIWMGENYEVGDTLLEAASRRTGGASTPEEAQQKIDEHFADKEWSAIYYDKNNPGHKAANSEMEALEMMVNPPGTSRRMA